MLVAKAVEQGWKPVGRLRLRDGSSYYQAFRRGSEYVWIGLRYIEHSKEAEAMDFVSRPTDAALFLGTEKDRDQAVLNGDLSAESE